MKPFKNIRLAYLEDMINDPEVQEHVEITSRAIEEVERVAAEAAEQEFWFPPDEHKTQIQNGSPDWIKWLNRADAVAAGDDEYFTIVEGLPSSRPTAFRKFYDGKYIPRRAIEAYKRHWKTMKLDFEGITINGNPNTYKGWWDSLGEEGIDPDLFYEVFPDGKQRIIKDSEDALLENVVDAIMEAGAYEWHGDDE